MSLINSNNKTIYNPKEVDINLNGTLVFPAGYTFKTIRAHNFSQSYFPAITEVSADAQYMNNNFNKRLALNDPKTPYRSNQIAKYNVQNGATLYIEDCVEMYDAEILIEPGGTVNYNSNTFISRSYDPNTNSNHPVIIDNSNNPSGLIDRAGTLSCHELNNLNCKYHYSNGINITQNTTWTNEELYIKGSLSISNGAELTLNQCTLRFADTDEIGNFSGIIVSSDAKLIVNNSLLDAVDFCQSKWSGIIAKGPNLATTGDPQVSSSEGNGGSSSASQVEISNSVIQNAYKGIWAVTNSSLIGGAVLDISDTDFFNNLVDIKIDNDINQVSTSIVDGCHFSSNDWFKSPFSKTANIEITGIDGVRIRNCEFVNGSVNNSITFNPVVGVQISESDMTISGNTFRGLEKGLEISNGEKNIVISSNTFTRNRQNLLVNSAGNIEIRNNTSVLNPNSQAVFNNFFNTITVSILSASEVDIRENSMDRNAVPGNFTAFGFPDLSNSSSNVIFDNSINN